MYTNGKSKTPDMTKPTEKPTETPIENPTETPAKSDGHDFTVEKMHKLIEDMLNDPNLGSNSRVVVNFDEGNQDTLKTEGVVVIQDPMLVHNFDYVLMSI